MFFEVIEEIWTFLIMVAKSPLRIVCKIKGEHDWEYHGGGFIFDCKYPFTCRKCGLRSTSDIDELSKHGFDGTAKIK